MAAFNVACSHASFSVQDFVLLQVIHILDITLDIAIGLFDNRYVFVLPVSHHNIQL